MNRCPESRTNAPARTYPGRLTHFSQSKPVQSRHKSSVLQNRTRLDRFRLILDRSHRARVCACIACVALVLAVIAILLGVWLAFALAAGVVATGILAAAEHLIRAPLHPRRPSRSDIMHADRENRAADHAYFETSDHPPKEHRVRTRSGSSVAWYCPTCHAVSRPFATKGDRAHACGFCSSPCEHISWPTILTILRRRPEFARHCTDCGEVQPKNSLGICIFCLHADALMPVPPHPPAPAPGPSPRMITSTPRVAIPAPRRIPRRPSSHNA